MYEGHMREGILEAKKEILSNQNIETGRYIFRKRKLLESTSMVHSPLDITLLSNEKQLKRYPNSKDLRIMKCEVRKGEALWLPSYWWHEVQSIPGKSNENTAIATTTRIEIDSNINEVKIETKFTPLNIAINFWFSPLYEKSFPCKKCKKNKLNQLYKPILKRFILLVHSQSL